MTRSCIRQRGNGVFSMNVNDLEVLAPIDAIELRQYQRAKVFGLQFRHRQRQALCSGGDGTRAAEKDYF